MARGLNAAASSFLIGFFIFFLGLPAARAQKPVHIVGTVTDEGVECPAVRTDDGTLYTLTGNIPRLAPGDRVEIVGTPAELSYCMQGVTLEAQAVIPVVVPGQKKLISLEGEILDQRAGVRDCLLLSSGDGKLYGLVPGRLALEVSPGPAKVFARRRWSRDLPCGGEVDEALDLVWVLKTP